MSAALNAPRWDGGPGFYEVWYLTLTDRGSGVGAWIRYTLHAPADGRPPTGALWFLVMDPAGAPLARKLTAEAPELSAAPFRATIAGASLDDGGMRGAFEDVAWDLRWDRPGGAYRHVTPALERLGVAQTVLVLPHADLAIAGTLRWGDRELVLDGARGGQAHLWGTRHAERWVWLHASDLEDEAGDPVPARSSTRSRSSRAGAVARSARAPSASPAWPAATRPRRRRTARCSTPRASR